MPGLAPSSTRRDQGTRGGPLRPLSDAIGTFSPRANDASPGGMSQAGSISRPLLAEERIVARCIVRRWLPSHSLF